MPTLPALTINSTNVDADELYAESLCDPTDAPPATLDMLNGKLDEDNYGAAIPPWAIQPGGFLRGIHLPFERWEFAYASQLSGDVDDQNEIVMACMSTRFFLPWDAGGVFVNWQAFWRHDATAIARWSDDEQSVYQGTLEEKWQAKFYVDGNEVSGGKLVLTASRWVEQVEPVDWATTGLDIWAHEDRWVWYSHSMAAGPTSMDFPNACEKGYHTLMCKITSTTRGGDPKKAKLLIPSGAVDIIAARKKTV